MTGGASMIRRLLEFLGLWEAAPCRHARDHFVASYPTLRKCGTSLRATEPDRFVVAVFYFDPLLPVKPGRYKVYAVSKDLTVVHELTLNPDSPYRIKGRR